MSSATVNPASEWRLSFYIHMMLLPFQDLSDQPRLPFARLHIFSSDIHAVVKACKQRPQRALTIGIWNLPSQSQQMSTNPPRHQRERLLPGCPRTIHLKDSPGKSRLTMRGMLYVTPQNQPGRKKKKLAVRSLTFS
jgi:hypothetical protein